MSHPQSNREHFCQVKAASNARKIFRTWKKDIFSVCLISHIAGRTGSAQRLHCLSFATRADCGNRRTSFCPVALLPFPAGQIGAVA